MPLADPIPNAETSTEVECAHCGLPVPKGLIDEASDEQFCCSGCDMAYKLIRGSGLDAFYAMVDGDASAGSLKHRAEKESRNRFADFDQQSFQETFAKELDKPRREISLLLDGIHCAACIWLIEKIPQLVPGVHQVKLNWARKTATIVWNSDQVPLSKIADTLYRLGYTPHPICESENESRRQNENRRHLIRIGIAAAAAGNNMLIATALYLGMFSHMTVGMTGMLRIASCVVGIAALLGPGQVFLQGAMAALRTRTPHMDLPIALGLSIGSVAGLVNTFRGVGEIYFDSLSVLIFLLLVGRWIQFRQQNRAADAVELLYRMTPKMTRKIVDGRAVETFVDLIEHDDLLEIRAGDLIPVDAVVVSGTSDVDESILSGESRPLRKVQGDEVLAGTRNGGSVLTVRATAIGNETRLSKIVDLVEQASLDKPQVVQWANRIGGHFVVAVIVLAIVTFVSWLWVDASLAVDRAVALLIVACPCALALATPLAVSVALGRSAKRKIMIKGGDVLQMLNQPGMIWLDKTGTITEGNVQVVRWHGEDQYQSLVAALEQKSSHPIASAFTSLIVDEASSRSTTLTTAGGSHSHVVASVEESPLGGICGIVDGRNLVVGTEKLLASTGVETDSWQSACSEILESGLAPCWIAVDNKVVAIAALGDQIRSDTSSAIEQLRTAGWQVGIISGDHDNIVKRVASRLNIAPEMAFGGLSPEEKVAIVNSGCDTVVMVGDGVNDSAALAAATVGIAVHNGAEASLAAAPVYLAEEGLTPILKLLAISKSTSRTIRRNFAASLAYNICGATLAAFGLINPLVAAILMPVSSLTVVAISLTAGRTSATESNR